MKYAYDKGFKKVAFNIPFSGLVCKLSHKPQEILLGMVKIPNDVSIRDFSIEGYHDDSIHVKEIVPENPSDIAILVLHGGGFGYKTSPHQLLNACEYATKLQCRAFLLDYHLLPDFPFPAAYEDAMEMYRYMVTHAKELAIHPEKIIVLGDSAGGTLAANVCNMAQSKGLPMPCCQVLIYPATDNEMTTESMNQFPDTPMWNARNNKKLWNMYLKNATDEEINIAVPMKNPLPDILPPTYVETAQFDCLHDEGLIYAKHIEMIAKNIVVNDTKGTIHGYDILLKHSISQENMRKRIDFMKSIVIKGEMNVSNTVC